MAAPYPDNRTPCQVEVDAYLAKVERGDPFQERRRFDLFDSISIQVGAIRRRHERYAAKDVEEDVPWGGWTFQPADMI